MAAGRPSRGAGAASGILIASRSDPVRFFPEGRKVTMSETVSETRACDLLSRVFRARGYSISRNVMFHEYGVEFHVDGWDAAARVGFEFLSSEDDDHDDLTLREYKTLMDAQQRGELSLFIIDEVEPVSAVDLAEAANDFLDEMEEAVKARRQAAGRKKAAKPAGIKAAKKAQKKGPGKTSRVARKPKAAAKKIPTATTRKRPAKSAGAKKRRVGG